MNYRNYGGSGSDDITESGLSCIKDGIRGTSLMMREWCELDEYEVNMQEGVNSKNYCNNWNEEEADCDDYYWSYTKVNPNSEDELYSEDGSPWIR